MYSSLGNLFLRIHRRFQIKLFERFNDCSCFHDFLNGTKLDRCFENILESQSKWRKNIVVTQYKPYFVLCGELLMKLLGTALEVWISPEKISLRFDQMFAKSFAISMITSSFEKSTGKPTSNGYLFPVLTITS